MTSRPTMPALGEADLVVVGAGIVGLAHAAQALARGASVTVVERDAYAVGASVRNFGHSCITAQDGLALELGLAARPEWLRLAKEADFWLRDAGTVVVARADDEYAALEDFADLRGDEVALLDATAVRSRVPAVNVVGGAWLPLDLRVDPREAVPAIARWLAQQGVRFLWSTAVTGIRDGAVLTVRGPVAARRVVVAVGHDVDHLFPDVAETAELTRCRLSMLEVTNPTGRSIEPAVLTGTSMLRYPGFAASPGLDQVRRRLAVTDPIALEAGLNLMFTARPDGNLVIGDTHHYGRTVDPFRDEAYDDLVLDRTAALLGVDRLAVVRRWQGVYASAPQPFLVATPRPEVRVVSVTSGIGMTTALGLAPTVLDTLLD